MKEETKAMLAEAFKTSVRKAVAKGNHARWGEAESVAVVSDMTDALMSDEDASAEGFDCIRGYVAKVVNPSAFAQSLDKLPNGTDRERGTYDEASGKVREAKAGEDLVAHPSYLNRPKRGTGGAKGTIEV